MTTLKVKVAELLLVSTFERPIFDLWSNTPELFSALQGALAPDGFHATDLRWEKGNGATDTILLFHLLAFRLTVRLRVDQVEIQSFVLPSLDPITASAAVSALLGALSEYRPQSALQAHTLSLGFHGELEGQPVQPFLASFVREAPGGLGPAAGVGCVFYFGQEDGRVSLSVTLDASSEVADGLFFRVFSIWEHAAMTPERMRAIASEHASAVASRFGLAIAYG